jgi:hypothetical protein
LRVAGQRGDDTGLALARGPFAQFVEKLANGSRGSQYRFERWFAGLIGGFEEFDVVLAAVKEVDRAGIARFAGIGAPVDPTDLRVTSDVRHEAAAVESDPDDELPNAAPVIDGDPPFVARPSGDRGERTR